jgi:hypothetical protein
MHADAELTARVDMSSQVCKQILCMDIIARQKGAPWYAGATQSNMVQPPASSYFVEALSEHAQC